ncbi:MAG TPA: ATPase P [Desulfonatronum sp.]|nr:ATPase P [Desulfonatronum sp.]
MLTIEIPGWKTLNLAHLVLDYNGTLALDGRLLPGVRERLCGLSPLLDVHVLTADTFGSVREQLRDISCAVSVIPSADQALAKADYLKGLDPAKCVAVGNGRNDALMLGKAELGIALIQEEGAAAKTVAAAEVVCRTINNALDLLSNPLRLAATLRG